MSRAIQAVLERLPHGEHGRQFAREPNPRDELTYEDVLTDLPDRNNVMIGRLESDADTEWIESTEVVHTTRCR